MRCCQWEKLTAGCPARWDSRFMRIFPYRDGSPTGGSFQDCPRAPPGSSKRRSETPAPHKVTICLSRLSVIPCIFPFNHNIFVPILQGMGGRMREQFPSRYVVHEEPCCTKAFVQSPFLKSIKESLRCLQQHPSHGTGTSADRWE